MTYKEWFTTQGKRFGLDEADVALILANQVVAIPDEEETVNPQVAKLALCKEFASMIPLANVSEGGYSVTWNWEAIKFWYNTTCDELGITPVTTPKVRDASNRW